MSYSVIYSNEFDSFLPLMTVKLQIEKKDFTGTPIDIVLSGNPIIQEWQEDDPKAPIRGCTLKVNIITDSNGLSLQDFYSEEDNTFKAIVKRGQTDEILFVGYLLQDDCAELYVDFNHEISLTFTDNLGILKDITLDQAAVNIGGPTVISAISITNLFPVANNTIQTLDPRIGVLKNGDTFSLFDGTNTYNFICYNISYSGSILGYLINIGIVVPFSGTITFDLTYTAPVDLVNYFSLAQILRLCLRSTNLDLNTNVMSTLCPNGGTTNELVLDTFLLINTFKRNDSWLSCYDILEQILSRFNASLFQAHGAWYIVRFDEMYNYLTLSGATWSGFGYDYDFNTSGVTKNIVPFTFLSGNDMETGVLKSIVRPFQYVKETFNYIHPESLMKNNNLQELGPLISEYNSGTNIIKEYDLFYWIPWVDHPSPTVTKLIRVVFDNDITSESYGTEIDRYIVIKGQPYDTTRAIMYEGIELSEGDVLEWSFDYKTENSEPGIVTNVFEIALQDGIIPTKWISTDGNWITTFSGTPYGIVFQILSGDNANGWHTVKVKSKSLPYNGIVFPFLTSASSNNTNYETHYKNLSFNVYNNINGIIKIIGHTHEDYQLNNLKNNIDKEIYIDNSPSTSINGTLMLQTYIGYIRNRCTIWKYPSTPLGFTFSNLGNGMTQEALFSNYFAKTKFEGNYLNLINAENVLTPFAVFIPANDPYHSRYVPGKMTIDYKNGSCNLTLYQWIYFPTIIGGSDPDLNPSGFDYFYIFCNSKFYEFNYLYEKS